MMQPKLKSKVLCADREVGEIRRVIVDPISLEISHIVVGGDGMGLIERQVPMGQIQSMTDDVVTLRSSSSDFAGLPAFKRDDYVTTHEVEIANLDDKIHVTPGEVLVPLPRAREEREAANLLCRLYPCHRPSYRSSPRMARSALPDEAHVPTVR